ncbi:MAG: hypothetical protein Q8P10_00005, partial [bacterium]|nr:hypothetical protein [bacterium]
RLKEKHDGNEIYEKKEILEKVAAGYEWLVNEFPSEFVVLDGERSVDIITSKIIEKIKTKEK